jgi:hypothetical protein
LRSVTAVVAQLSFLVLLLGPHPVWAGEASDSTPAAPDKAKSGPKVGDRSKSSPRLTSDKPKEEKEAPNYHRYAFLGAGALGAGGLVFSFIAHGQQERAKTLSSAGEAGRTIEDARQSAATANVLYALAGVTLVYALVLEFLPRPDAEKASLTFHF